jgi:hypothetical protein
MVYVILAAMILAAAVLAAVLLFYNPDDNKEEKLGGKGNWFITERTAGPNATAICVVRMNGNRETNVIRVATLRDDAEDWTTRYEEAMARARERLFSLQGNK